MMQVNCDGFFCFEGAEFILFFIGLLVIYLGFYNLKQYNYKINYLEEVSGTITSVSRRIIKLNNNVEITIRYSVEGKEYQIKKKVLDKKSLVEGKEIKLYYDLSTPENAQTIPNTKIGIYFLLVFGMLFFIPGVLGIFGIIN